MNNICYIFLKFFPLFLAIIGFVKHFYLHVMRHTYLANLLNPCVSYVELEHFFLFRIMIIFSLSSKGFGGVAGSIRHLAWSLLQKLVNRPRPLTIFADRSVLGVWLFLAMLICLKNKQKTINQLLKSIVI